ncbi:hypothetical protein [Actinokineospora globicatena]|uniref:hypothetical protein n=1 Tax=Actinokineospora globicatena TaxID=103729 RepID=UPI0020A3D65A|nr:hypothetical protein [Actinokineospora globicatena]MCP2304981.1 hypothetical protein [Actinokineospora globicatena]GLW80443.1 hypothetical protein Aglo01_49240 [Actinokineospora globicatena]GLW87271.1 hypothetical protein Aglo02_49100 [Actinokineospora globicatena]
MRGAVTAVVASLVVLAGCSSEEPPSVVPEFGDAKALGAAIDALAAKERTVHMTVPGKPGYESIVSKGSVRMDQPDTALEMVVPNGQETWKVLTLGEHLYLSRPQATPSGKQWQEIGPDSKDKSDQAIAGVTGGFGSLDPRRVAADLGAGVLVEAKPDQDATRYRVRISTDKLTSAFGLSETVLLRLPQSSFPVDAWVGPGGRLLRFEAHLDEAAGKTFRTSYSDWGQSVEIDAPKPEEIEPKR